MGAAQGSANVTGLHWDWFALITFIVHLSAILHSKNRVPPHVHCDMLSPHLTHMHMHTSIPRHNKLKILNLSGSFFPNPVCLWVLNVCVLCSTIDQKY